MIIFARNDELNQVLQGLRPSYPEIDFNSACEESGMCAFTINGVMVVILLSDILENDRYIDAWNRDDDDEEETKEDE